MKNMICVFSFFACTLLSSCGSKQPILKQGTISNFSSLDGFGLSIKEENGTEKRSKLKKAFHPYNKGYIYYSSSPVHFCSLIGNKVQNAVLLDENEKEVNDYHVEYFQKSPYYYNVSLIRRSEKVTPLFETSIFEDINTKGVPLSPHTETFSSCYIISKESGKIFPIGELYEKIQGVFVLGDDGYKTTFFEGQSEKEQPSLWSIREVEGSLEIKELMDSKKYQNYLSFVGTPMIDRYGNLISNNYCYIQNEIVENTSENARIGVDCLTGTAFRTIFNEKPEESKKEYTLEYLNKEYTLEYLNEVGEFVPVDDKEYKVPFYSSTIYNSAGTFWYKDYLFSQRTRYHVDMNSPYRKVEALSLPECARVNLNSILDGKYLYCLTDSILYQVDLLSLEAIPFELPMGKITSFDVNVSGIVTIKGVTKDLEDVTGYIVDGKFTYEKQEYEGIEENRTYYISALN